MLGLTPRQIEALAMIEIDRMTYAQAGQAMGITRESAFALAKRARARLQEQGLSIPREPEPERYSLEPRAIDRGRIVATF